MKLTPHHWSYQLHGFRLMDTLFLHHSQFYRSSVYSLMSVLQAFAFGTIITKTIQKFSPIFLSFLKYFRCIAVEVIKVLLIAFGIQLHMSSLIILKLDFTALAWCVKAFFGMKASFAFYEMLIDFSQTLLTYYSIIHFYFWDLTCTKLFHCSSKTNYWFPNSNLILTPYFSKAIDLIH
jgi:hypothetical protein